MRAGSASDSEIEESIREFEVTLDMIQAGAQLYWEYDYEEEEPQALVAAILFAARDLWRDGSKCQSPTLRE